MSRSSLYQRFAEQGFVLVEEAVSASELERLRHLVAGLELEEGRGGARSLFRQAPDILDLASSGSLLGLAEEALDAEALPVKATLFDKTPGANWKLPFHQDTVVALRHRREAPGFSAWSLKDGIPHAQAPAEVLGRMVALRLHLDPTPAENGALRVVPGSHRFGRLSGSEVRELRRRRGEHICAVEAGGAMLMSPLLLHASSPSESPEHRRVVHLEYASGELPAGLEWPRWA